MLEPHQLKKQGIMTFNIQPGILQQAYWLFFNIKMCVVVFVKANLYYLNINVLCELIN